MRREIRQTKKRGKVHKEKAFLEVESITGHLERKGETLLGQRTAGGLTEKKSQQYVFGLINNKQNQPSKNRDGGHDIKLVTKDKVGEPRGGRTTST